MRGPGRGRQWLQSRSADEASFDLERFVWSTPDQLEVTGRFTGVGATAGDAPVLVIHSEAGTERLDAAAQEPGWPPTDGDLWRGSFGWDHPPEPFQAAELDLGGGQVVALPPPGAHEGGSHLLVQAEGDASAPVQAEDDASAPAPEVQGADRVRYLADRLAAQAELRSAREATATALAEAARLRDELEAERGRHAADAERFREDLAAVQRVADETISQAREQTRGAVEAREAELRRLAEERDAAQAELGAARARVAELEESAADAERAREQAQQLGDRLDRVRRALEGEG